MKKMPTRSEADELRPEYDFDYSKARPNPYAARLKGHSVAVLLAPDVAPSFPTADSVNDILRAVIHAVPRPARRPARLKAQPTRKAGSQRVATDKGRKVCPRSLPLMGAVVEGGPCS